MPPPTPPCTCPTEGIYQFDPHCTLHGMDVIRHLGPLLVYEALHSDLHRESASLLIEHAGEHNLDWTWRVTYTNGRTGQKAIETGAELPATVAKITRSRNTTWSRA